MSAGAALRGHYIERLAIAVCFLAPQLFASAAEPGLNEIIAYNNKALWLRRTPGVRGAS